MSDEVAEDVGGVDGGGSEFTYSMETPMLVVKEEDFVELKAIPRSNEAAEKGLLIDVDSIEDRLNTLVIFISHRWLQPEKGTPNPDNHQAEKFRLIKTGLTAVKKSVSEDTKVVMWIDFFGIDQDDADKKLQGIRSLPAYIERSDMLLTPIASNSNYTLTQIDKVRERARRRGFKYSRKLNFSSAFAKDLEKFHHTEELFSRGWIRLEEYLGSNVELAKNSFGYFKRIKNHRTDRPHVFITETIFTTKPHKYKLIILPRLSKGVLQVLNPLDLDNSELTNEEDREYIRIIMEAAGFVSEEFNKPLHDVYTGETDEEGHREGEGVLDYANGNTYKGSFSKNKRHGKGTYFYANGDKFEGIWVDDERDDNQEFVATTADGVVYTSKVKLIPFAKRFGQFPKHMVDEQAVLFTQNVPK